MFSCVCGQTYVHCAMQIAAESALHRTCGFQPQLYEDVSYRSKSSLGRFNASAPSRSAFPAKMALSGALQACDRFQLAPRATRRLNGHSTVAWNPLTATRKASTARAALSQLSKA